MQCLNVKNKEVAALLEEYTNILGNENAAYYVLSENNGYGLDKAPNGADSKLFSDLLNHYNGDRNKAILAKSRVYSDSFRNWFGNWLSDDKTDVSKVIDFNDSVDFLFEVNPELSKVGTKSEYEQYVKTIFPNSILNSIYWHGTDSDFSDGLNTAKRGKGSGAPETQNEMYFNRQPWASLQYISGINRKIKDNEGFNNWVKLWWELKEALGNGRMDTDDWKNEIIGPNTRQSSPNKRGIFDRDKGGTHGKYLSERKARYGYENKSDKEFFEEVFDIRYGKETFNDWINRKRDEFKSLWNNRSVKNGIIPAVLNVRNPIVEEGQNTYYEEQRGLFTQAKQNGNDAILSNKSKNEFGSDVAIVFNPNENVHFLGTKSDIENFKKWKSNNQVSKVIDENGEPLIVYHGSDNGINNNVIDLSKSDDGISFFTTKDVPVSESYMTSYDDAIEYINNQYYSEEEIENLLQNNIDYWSVSDKNDADDFLSILDISEETSGIERTNVKSNVLISDINGYNPYTKKEEKGKKYVQTIEFDIYIPEGYDVPLNLQDLYNLSKNDLKTLKNEAINKHIVLNPSVYTTVIDTDAINKADSLRNKQKRYSLFESVKNPLIINSEYTYNWNKVPFEGNKYTTREIAKIAKDRGYDGVIFNNIIDDGGKSNTWNGMAATGSYEVYKGDRFETVYRYDTSVFVAFDPNQIKSVDNQGTFSTSDNNIYNQTNSVNSGSDSTFFNRLFNNKEEQDVNTILSNIESTNSKLKPLTSFLREAIASNDFLKNVKIKYSTTREGLPENVSDSAAYYNTDSNTITVFADSSFKGKGNLADTTILHELIHAASITNLSFNPSKKQEIDSLLDHVRQELSKKYGVSWEELQNINPDTYYGLTNSYEFLSEVFSNSKFINELIRIDSSKNLNNKKSTVIGKIIEWIKSILNINSNDNSYNEAMLQLEDIILNYNDKLEDFNYDLYNQAYNNLSYEYFADNQTTSNPKYIEETFKKQKEHIAFESETHTYTNVETGEVYTPVSVVKDANGYGADVTAMSDEDLVYGKQAAAVGTAIHNTIHNILTGDNVQETNEFGIKMSNEAVKMIKEVVIPKLFGNKYTVLASEQIISNDDAKIAGTLDLLMRDNKGKIHLMDIKTKARTFKGKKKYGFDYYFSAKKETKFGGKPDASRHDYQLTMYKRMLEMLGIKVDHKEIIPLEYTLDENGVITEVWVAPLDYAESNGVIYHRTNNALEQEINSNVFVNNVSSDIENGELLKQSEIVANILKVLKNQLALYKIKGYTTKSEVLKKYIDELNSLEEKEIIVSYIKKSIDLLKPLIDDYNSNNKLERLGNNNVWNLKTLSAWKNYAESFSNLDDIQDYLFNNSSKFSKKEFEDIQESLAIAINYRNVLENSYKSKGEKIWLDWLLPFSTRVEAEYRDMAEREYKKNNKNTTRLNDVAAMNQYIENYVNSHRNEINNKSRELLRQQSKIATGGTLNSFSRWLDTIFESNDVIVGSMARAYHTRWMQSLDDFNNRYKELLSLTEELENTYPEYKNNPSKLYEFMIETDENGSRLISELSSKFLEDYENIKRTIKADPKYEDSKDRAIAIAAWLEENAPIKGKLKLDKEKLEYIETLFSIGKISLEEKNILIRNEKRDQSFKKSWAELVSKGKLNEEAADLLRVKFNELNWKYRVPNKDKYKNSKWDTLQNIRESNPNDIRVRYFDFISNLASLGDSYVPTRFKLNGRLPGMSKTTAERLVSGNVTKALWENLKNQFQVRADDTDKGMQMTDELDRPVKFIPIYFTTRVPNEEQSFDIGTIYKEWFRSVNNYQYINSILPQLEYTKWVISNRKTIKTDYKGNPIKNVLSRVMNNGDSDIDPTTNALVTDENLIAQLNTWFDQVIYGEENKDMGTTFGIDNAKALNLFQTYTSLKVMGVNAISMVNNALMAEVQQSIESFAKQYITPESYTKASVEYSRELLDGDILGDIGKRSPKSLVNLLNEHFGIFTDFNEGSLLDNTRVKKLSKLSTLFFTTNIGEHEAQSRFLLASLMDKRALDKDGNDIGSVFDYFLVEDGKLVFDKEHKVANFKRKDQIAFGQQISAIIRKMHGNYANYSKVALQQYGIGKLALAFRKWIWTTAKRRWSKQYYDEFGQTFSKGYYRDGAAFAYNKVMSFFERFVDEAKALEYAEKADWDTMTENEKANVKRFITELSIFSIMSVMSMLISKYEPDDDDEVTKFVLNHLDYQLFRLSTDITFYINPASTMKIIQSPIPSSSVIRSISNFIEACLNPLAEYEKGDRKGELKLKYRFMDLVPITRQIYRLRNIEDEQQLLSIF